MAQDVKPKRPYASARRRKQAAATRREILEAAERLFTERGYPATTMEAIAEAAGVSLKTAYLPFTTKAGLLRALWDLRLKGDEADAPVADRDWYRAVVDEPDPRRRLQLVGAASRRVKERIGPMLRIIRGAATVDADLADLWQLIQTDFHANQRALLEGVAPALRPGLTLDRAADLLWTLNHPDVWLLLVVERGWAPAEWEEWFVSAATSALLEPSDSSHSPKL